MDEPTVADSPAPIGLVIAFILLGFWGGAYLTEYNGGFRKDVFNHQQKSWVPVEASAAKKKDPAALGKKVFTANCVICHQTTGLGMPGLYPPLAGSELVLGQGYNDHQLILILLNGLNGPIKIKGETYNGAMPAWKDSLRDDQIANVLTYIRQEWGNSAAPITTEAVAALRGKHGTRAEAWTDSELKATQSTR